MEPRNPAAERSSLLAILLERSLRFGKFKLASGAESDFYVDVRKTNLDPEGVRLVARLLADVSALGCVVAREAGGRDRLGQKTTTVHALYTLAELLKAAGRPLPS